MSNVLVTGGAGFIGSHLVDALLAAGFRVIALDDLSTGRLENLAGAFGKPAFELWAEDIAGLDPGRLAGVETVYHLAAAKKTACVADPLRDCRVNALGTLHLLECARLAGVERVVLASTGSVYGESPSLPLVEDQPLRPVSIYGVSKLAGEGYARFYSRQYGLPVTILRYFHVYGPRQDWSEKGGVVSIFIHRLLHGLPLVIHGDGSQQRTFTYVRDVVKATLAAAAWNDRSCEAYNVSSGEINTVRELADRLAACLGVPYTFQYGPPVPGDIIRFAVSNWKLARRGFRFEDGLAAGLLETVRWFQENQR